MSNLKLRSAQANKKDEFYTRLEDIERELRHYKDHFKDKVVFCNCDDPFESNFVKYFALNFNYLGLKKLIATCYVDSPVAGEQLSLFDILTLEESPKVEGIPHKIEITEVEDFNKDGAIDLLDIEYLLKNKKNTLTILKGDGDFRSEEAIELIKEADIVVTNPPFSLFREYVGQLMEYEKKFIIIGHQNALTYKEIFPYIKENRMWLGYGFKGGAGHFINKHYQDYATAQDKREGMIRVSGVVWFTNLDISKRNEVMILYKEYNPNEYPKYDNFNAINVDKTNEIPENYYGLMGVPITFMNKYNPKQFEIIDGIGRYSILKNEETKKAGKYLSMINGEAKYFRIIIRRKRDNAS